MKRRWYTGILALSLIFVLSGCNNGQATTDSENPLQFNEVPVEAQTFDWSQVTTDTSTLEEGLDNYPSEVSDWVAEGLNLETGGELPAFNFEETNTQYQSVEDNPNEIPLEGGMPLEGSNNDPNLGLENQLPSATIDTTIETNVEDGETPTVQPTTQPTAQPTSQPTTQPTSQPTSSTNSETLPKTADVPLVVFSVIGLAILITLIAVLKKPLRAND